jgi:hypothetical protein
MTVRKCIGNDIQRRKRTRRTCLESGGRCVVKDVHQNVPTQVSVANEGEVLLDECPVCFESFSVTRPRFASGNCPHFICFNCYLTMIKNSCKDFDLEFPCPLCREPFGDVALLLKTQEEKDDFPEE